MATVEWRVRADEFANCNCAYGCPCQFNALPTHGFCEAAAAWKIHEGHFGEVRLDRLNCGFVIQFPGAVHEGNGTIQLVVEDKADPLQRDALIKIMSGEETEDRATMWWVIRPCRRTSWRRCSCRSILRSMSKPGERGSIFRV